MLIIVDSFSKPVKNGAVFTVAAIVMAIVLTLFLLRAIGIFKLSKKAGIKSAFMAFIPFVWIFPACKLVKESKFFNTTIGKLAVIFTIICALTEMLSFAYEFLVYFPYVGNFLMGRDIYMIVNESYVTDQYFVLFEGLGLYGKVGEFVNPYTDVYAMQKVMDGIGYTCNILSILHSIIIVWIYIALFKKYWPQHFALGAICSIFGLDGPFIFAIRNKEPVNYMDYLRSRYHAYGNPYGPYGGQGQHGSFYGGDGRWHNAQKENPADSEEPFGEFQDKKDKKPDEPFSDF